MSLLSFLRVERAPGVVPEEEPKGEPRSRRTYPVSLFPGGTMPPSVYASPIDWRAKAPAQVAEAQPPAANTAPQPQPVTTL